ncbi:MAG: ferritin-like domain-containing protein, partial [Verrucomicrobia subdivision 3 bacterium]|nr:ferritin-like domain-containing protein [Limisphaerales bacterium]
RVNVPRKWREPFISSLQRFQLGESGEGRHLRKLAAATGDAPYAAAIELFIREEQRHAELMAGVLKRLDAPLLTSHWSDKAFTFMRHLPGLHTELLVLLLPEMIAKIYFRALAGHFDDPAIATVAAQILEDEEGHLAFHAHYLNEVLSRIPFGRRILLQIGWRCAYRAVCLVVYSDHRTLLQLLGMTLPKFWSECGEVFDEVAAKIFSPAHVLGRAIFPIESRA